MIPSVVASESGTAQTGGSASGVVGARHGTVTIRPSAWKRAPQRVRAPYVKEKTDSEYPEYRGTRETPWEDGWTTIQA